MSNKEEIKPIKFRIHMYYLGTTLSNDMHTTHYNSLKLFRGKRSLIHCAWLEASGRQSGRQAISRKFSQIFFLISHKLVEKVWGQSEDILGLGHA